jgi:hypothetical protein
VQIHNKKSAGSLATARKEAIQREIKEQMDLGAAGLLDEDHWMIEVNLDPESSSGEQEEYWLLAIKAARKASILARQQDHATQHDRDRRWAITFSPETPVSRQGRMAFSSQPF